MFGSRKNYAVLAVVTILTAVVLAACSPKKNTAASRKYQEFITRYNIYYNGDTHLKETLADMESKYEDDYSRPLFMHPVEAKTDPSAPQPSGDFNRSIEKAQKAIQLRSIKKKPAKKAGKNSDPKYKEWMKRDEYNPFLHNAWMMLADGQYYNGDFLGAASTYFYISKHFTWLPATVTEAKLMQALCYIALDWGFEAEMILARIKKDDLTSAELRRLYNFAYADFYLGSEKYSDALPFLVEAAKKAKGAQKIRLNFLLGQVYQRLGDKQKAYKAFESAGKASNATYRTKFNARIKQSEVYTGADIEQEVKALRRMTRYDRNKDYLDQVYYAIGNIYLSHGDTLKAIENYEIANEKSTRNGIDKALNQLQLGELYFLLRNYEKAQPAYSEAVPLLPESHPGYDLIKRRSDVLDELAIYSQNVNLQDSLLRLADMDPDERMKIINKIIADLKKKEEEEAREAAREEYLANQAAMGGGLQDNNTPSFSINSDNSWYFYNTATKAAGKTEFQKRWGSRKLEDDWRRRNKATFNMGDFDAPEDSDSSDEAEDTEGAESTEEENTLPAADDPHEPDYYLAQIPQTPEDRQLAHDVIQEGLFNMGVILKDKLEDFGAADAEFDRLLKDYPDNVYRLDTYYNLYLMNMRQGNLAAAEQWRRLIISDFPDSQLGIALKDPAYIDNLRQMDARQQGLYDRAYEAYLDNRNSDVHRIYAEMKDLYPMSTLIPKFMFIDALAYVTEKDSESFNATLRELLERYPDTDITPVASAWLKGMAQGRQLQAGDSNMRGMIWDLRLSNDSIDVGGDNGPAEFELNPDSRQLLVFTFPTDKVSTNELLFDIARHNFRAFVVRDFDLEPMNFGRLGMIVVRGFANQAELNHYRSVMASSPDIKLPAGVRPIAISEANFDLLLEQGRSFDEYFRYLEEQNYIDAQEGLLMPEDIEELPEEPEEIIEEIEYVEPTPALEPGKDEEPLQPEPVQPEPVDNEPAETEPGQAGSEPVMLPAQAPIQTPVPAPKPAAPAPAPTSASAPAPAPAPAAKPAPAPTTPPVLPGSEGDDPLFDDD